MKIAIKTRNSAQEDLERASFVVCNVLTMLFIERLSFSGQGLDDEDWLKLAAKRESLLAQVLAVLASKIGGVDVEFKSITE